MASRLWFSKLLFSIGLPMLIIGITLFGVFINLKRRHVSKNVMSKKEKENLLADVKVNQILKKQMKENGHLDEEGVILELKMNIRRVKRKINNSYAYYQSNILPIVLKYKIRTHGVSLNGKLERTYINPVKYPRVKRFFDNSDLLRIKKTQLFKELDELVVNPYLNMKIDLENKLVATHIIKLTNTRLSKENTNNQIKLTKELKQNPEYIVDYFAEYSIKMSHYTDVTGTSIPNIDGVIEYFDKNAENLKLNNLHLTREMKGYEIRIEDIDNLQLKY